MITEIQVALVISGISAAVSLFSLFLSWRAFNRDRTDLKAFISFNREGGHGAEIVIELVNFGRRPIVVQSISLFVEGGNRVEYWAYAPEMKKLPTKLLENETTNYRMPLYPYRADNRLEDPRKIKAIEVRDSTKKVFRIPRLGKCREWRTFKDELSQSLNEKDRNQN